MQCGNYVNTSFEFAIYSINREMKSARKIRGDFHSRREIRSTSMNWWHFKSNLFAFLLLYRGIYWQAKIHSKYCNCNCATKLSPSIRGLQYESNVQLQYESNVQQIKWWLHFQAWIVWYIVDCFCLLHNFAKTCIFRTKLFTNSKGRLSTFFHDFSKHLQKKFQ